MNASMRSAASLKRLLAAWLALAAPLVLGACSRLLSIVDPSAF